MNMDGGIDEIPLGDVPGRLWLCGKHVIGPDHEAVMQRIGADHVVCLVQTHELEGRYDAYATWLRTEDRSTWFAIHDLSSPPLAEILPVYESVVQRLQRAETVIVHCAAGVGRAGTLAVAVCQLIGMELDEALRHVRQHRPGAGPEAGSQLEVVTELAELLGR